MIEKRKIVPEKLQDKVYMKLHREYSSLQEMEAKFFEKWGTPFELLVAMRENIQKKVQSASETEKLSDKIFWDKYRGDIKTVKTGIPPLVRKNMPQTLGKLLDAIETFKSNIPDHYGEEFDLSLLEEDRLRGFLNCIQANTIENLEIPEEGSKYISRKTPIQNVRTLPKDVVVFPMRIK
jgi:hypothetical protein